MTCLLIFVCFWNPYCVPDSAIAMPEESGRIFDFSQLAPQQDLMFASGIPPRDSVQNSRKRGQSKEGSQRWMNP
ncbi:hypothetical protein [Ralstonia pseudosolanacearum]|uniref:hypothetical protein n=1 Tax=Ralstonia pseudosolanacearum TaxID=1310165 RepID=UPI002234AB16|nr:hypothetical protein [Ralstonia sp. RS647]UZF37615.1 hypothetical protein LGV81_26180 [Ralstonia sp. RS647]